MTNDLNEDIEFDADTGNPITKADLEFDADTGNPITQADLEPNLLVKEEDHEQPQEQARSVVVEYDADTGNPTTKSDLQSYPVEEEEGEEEELPQEQARPAIDNGGLKYSEFQVLDEFPPDKEDTWQYSQEDAGWVLAHNALRGELDDIHRALETVQGQSLKAWQIQAIQRFMAVHFLHTHGHHYNEDAIMTPFLKERFQYPEKLESDHEVLEEKMVLIQNLIKDLKEGDTVDALLEEWVAYRDITRSHLAEEEETALPMMRAYFTQQEEAVKVQEIMKHAPKVEIGSFIHYQGVKRFRTVFMPQESIPSFVWMIDFKGKHKAFQREFMEPLNSLKAGIAPRPKLFASMLFAKKSTTSTTTSSSQGVAQNASAF